MVIKMLDYMRSKGINGMNVVHGDRYVKCLAHDVCRPDTEQVAEGMIHDPTSDPRSEHLLDLTDKEKL